MWANDLTGMRHRVAGRLSSRAPFDPLAGGYWAIAFDFSSHHAHLLDLNPRVLEFEVERSTT